MQKYGGTLIHRSRDEHGPLEIVDEPGARSLHFGSSNLQSRMRLDDPAALMLAYTRAMAAALLFRDAPRSVLMLGLGGGSLAKFFLHHFPDCRLRVVEYRESIVGLARAYFCLPDDPRLRIYIGDAGVFLQEYARRSYDLILVDIFDAWGPDALLEDTDFLAACRDRLRPDGITSINCWFRKDREQICAISRFQQVFAQTLQLPVPSKDNCIILAFPQPLPLLALKPLRHKAGLLQTQFAIEFPRLLRDLRLYNPSAFHLKR